jgi:hypothetical protein
MLLPDLENIKRIMLEKYNEKLKAKVKATTAHADGKGEPKKSTSGGGPSDWVSKKAHTEKFCQSHKIHHTSNCHHYDKESKPLGTSIGKPSDGKKPYKKFGGNKSIAYMTVMLEAIQKGQKRAGKSKKCKKHVYKSSSDSDSE